MELNKDKKLAELLLLKKYLEEKEYEKADIIAKKIIELNTENEIIENENNIKSR